MEKESSKGGGEFKGNLQPCMTHGLRLVRGALLTFVKEEETVSGLELSNFLSSLTLNMQKIEESPQPLGLPPLLLSRMLESNQAEHILVHTVVKHSVFDRLFSGSWRKRGRGWRGRMKKGEK